MMENLCGSGRGLKNIRPKVVKHCAKSVLVGIMRIVKLLKTDVHKFTELNLFRIVLDKE